LGVANSAGLPFKSASSRTHCVGRASPQPGQKGSLAIAVGCSEPDPVGPSRCLEPEVSIGSIDIESNGTTRPWVRGALIFFRVHRSRTHSLAQPVTVCWLALSTGQLLVPDTVEAGELAIFEPSNHAVHIHAKPRRILFSVRLPRPLTALCSENTRCIPALQRCVRVKGIDEIQQRLQKVGRF
jgi:hypothetical protein